MMTGDEARRIASNPKANSDEQRRRREREAAQTGTDSDQARVLVSRIRAGELASWHVELLSMLGHAAALLVEPRYAGFLAPERENWDSALVALLRRNTIPGLELQKRFLSVVGIGACDRILRLVYAPWAEVAADEMRAERSAAHPGPDLNLPTEALALFVSTMSTNVRLGLDTDVPSADAHSLRLGGVERNLREFGRSLGYYDFGGESILSDYAYAMAELGRLMTDRGVRSFYAVMQHGYIVDELHYTRDDAQVEADRLNREADEETGGEVLGDGAASVVETEDEIAGCLHLLFGDTRAEGPNGVLDRLEDMTAFAATLSDESVPASSWVSPKTSDPLIGAVIEAQDRIAAARDSDPPRYWSIRHGLDYWSNEDGWTDARSATVFTASERERFSLPVSGRWVPGRPVTERVAITSLLRSAAVEFLIPWLLTGPRAEDA